MASRDSYAAVKGMAGVDRRREFCRMSSSLKQACQRWNHWQYRDARKGRSAEHWKNHAKKVRGLVEDAMKDTVVCERAVVLGAGFCTEVPLRSLCERFSRVTLVDVDTELIEAAVSRLGSFELAKQVELLEGDVSLIIESLVARVEDVLESHPAGMPQDAARSLIHSLLDSAAQGNATAVPLRVQDNSADLVFSSDVMSYALSMPVSWMDVSYEKRFGDSLGLEERKGNGSLLHAMVESHFHEIMRILKPQASALVETCIAHGPIMNDQVLIAVQDPVDGKLTYMGIPNFGYDSVARKMAELPHLIVNFMPRDKTLVLPESFRDWTVQISPLQPLMTPVGIVPAYYGNVFQSIIVKKAG